MELEENKKFSVFVENKHEKYNYFLLSFSVFAHDEKKAKEEAKLKFVQWCKNHNIYVGTIKVKFIKEIED